MSGLKSLACFPSYKELEWKGDDCLLSTQGVYTLLTSALPQVVKEDDNNWPAPDRVGKQELEIIINGQHISFTCTKLGSVLQVQQSKDPEGLRVFYYLVQVGWGRGTEWRSCIPQCTLRSVQETWRAVLHGSKA